MTEQDEVQVSKFERYKLKVRVKNMEMWTELPDEELLIYQVEYLRQIASATIATRNWIAVITILLLFFTYITLLGFVL